MNLTERRKVQTLSARLSEASFKEGFASGSAVSEGEAKRASQERQIAEQNLAAYLKVISR